MDELWASAKLAESGTDAGWPWRANLRMLQSWWRCEVLGSDAGPVPGRAGRPSDAWLKEADGARGRNFFDRQEFETTQRRRKTRGWGGMVRGDRLERSLLSSQPMCFNLFGVLQRHPSVLVSWLTSIGIDAVSIERCEEGDVDLVRIEYAPPRKDHLGSGSAFDACITYRDRRGRRGVVAIETKYAENLARQKTVPEGSKYEEATESSGRWKDSAVSVLNQPSPVQCWQNLLLVQKAVELGTHGWETGTFVMVADGHDRGAHQATSTLAGQLHDPGPWVRWSPLQHLVEVARSDASCAPWASWFTTRYLDLAPVEHHLLEDPNRNPVVIDERGGTWTT